MTAAINFTPLYGVEEDEPFSYLLQIDDFRILLDCGWDERFDEALLTPLKKIIDKIDVVLISHPDLAHMGALPYICGKLGLTAPIYTTFPVWKMGQMFMYDAYVNRAKFDFDVFDLDDVDLAFERITPLKYSQDVVLSDKAEGMTVTPYNAGHMLGGAIWKITKETEEIVYAVEFNHKRERHLNATVLEFCSSRPTVLITDACGLTKARKRQDIDTEFRETSFATIRAGGNVLVPCDAAGRSLEVLFLMHSYWKLARFGQGTYSLAFLGPLAYNTIQFAKSQIEWMSDNCMKEFDKTRENPFTFKDVQLCHNMEDLKALKQPYIVFATSAWLETGPSQDLLLLLAGNPRNTVFLTQRPPAWTLASRLLQVVEAAKAAGGPAVLEVQRRTNYLLEGQELQDYVALEQLKKEQDDLEQRAALSEDSDDEDDDDAILIDTAASVSKHVRLSARFPMYPFAEVRRQADVYGEAINPDDYKGLEDGSAGDQAKVKMEDASVEELEEKGPPKKSVVDIIQCEVKCAVKLTDYEGRSDLRSQAKLVTNCKPRKVILVRGSTKTKESLSKELAKSLKGVPVLSPRRGQRVDITMEETNILRVTLKDTFTQSLAFVKVADYEIAYAEGEVRIDYGESSLPVLRAAPSRLKRGHPAVLLGNLKFNDLKEVLKRNGVQAQYFTAQEVLVCNGGVVQIKRESGQQISIKGCMCEDYYKIREILYGLYEII